MKTLKLRLLPFILILTLLAFLVPTPALAQTVEPPLVEATLHPGEDTSFDLTVNTGPKPIPKIDVVFAIDITGSMGGEIDVVKDKAVEIMNDIRAKVPDSYFGLVSFSDYPGTFDYPGYSGQYGGDDDIPYQVNQQPTDDIATVASAIDGLSLRWGADWPQDYTRVLYEIMSVHWRALSKNIVIMFGDAPTHDLDFAGYNFGGDPGRDAIAMNDDDLDFETVVNQVKEEGIVVLAVDSGGACESEATFKGMSIGFPIEPAIEWAEDWADGPPYPEGGPFSSRTPPYCERCLAFVLDAYEYGASDCIDLRGKMPHGYAKEAADALGAESNTGAPPRGAYAFYNWTGTVDGEERNWGHAALSLGATEGDGQTQIIHAYHKCGSDISVIISDDYEDIGLDYIGWAWPPIEAAEPSPPHAAFGTGGQYLPLENAGQIPEAIKEMMEEEVAKIKHLTLGIPDEYKDWVAFTPEEYMDVGPETTKVFDVTITVPDDMEPGEHTFLIQVLGDGALLGSTQVSIIIPSPPLPDLGFRPNANGFKFANFGSDRSWEMFEQFFGEDVVRHSNDEKVYAAEQFFNKYYSRYVSGSCDGFSATSLINFRILDQPNAGAFSMPYYPILYDQDLNDSIRNAIAYQQGFWHGYEIKSYVAALSKASYNSPKFYYEKLKEYIESGNPVILSIWKKGNGGHSVVPYRFEEPSEDKAYVYVYDSNHPGDLNRKIVFDLKNDKWSYEFEKIFWIIPITWKGDSSYHSMTMVPLSIRLHEGIAPWTQDVLGDYADIVGGLGPTSLLFTDESGHRLGFTDGEFVDEIPGAIYTVPPLDEDVPFELYYLPEDISYTLKIRGTDEGTAELNVFSDHSLMQIKNATVHPSTVDNVNIGKGSRSLVYTTNDDYKEYSAIIAGELADTSRIITVDTSLSAGDTTTLELTDEQTFNYINSGGPKTYDLTLEQRGRGAGHFSYPNLTIWAGDTHIIKVMDWDNLDTTEIVLEIDEDSDGTIDEVEILSNHPPVAYAGPDQTVCVIAPATTAVVTLDGSGSYDADGDTLTYNWTWDGNTAHGVNATVELPLGITTITLVVNDGKADSEPDTVNITVNPKPTATASSNSPVYEGATIELYGGPNGMASYYWTGPNDFTNTGQNPTIPNATKAMEGTYTLVVTNGHGCTGTNSTHVEVRVPVVSPRGGGGGGCPSTKYLTVDWDGCITQKPLYSNDRLAKDLLGPSPDGSHSLLLEQATHAPVVDGKTHYLIEIRELEETPHLPENTTEIVAINVTPAGAVFDRDIFLTLGFDQLPENALNVTMAYYDDVNEVWVPLESEAGEPDGAVELTLSTAINHFTIYAVLVEVAPPSPPPPAHFAPSGLSIVTSVEKIWKSVTFVTKTGESVTITANVLNNGGQEGTYTVELKLNGETVDTKMVTLGAGQSQQVSFTLSEMDYGQYEVEVAGLPGEFTTSRTITWWLIIVIIVAIGLIIWGVVWGRRRRRKVAQEG